MAGLGTNPISVNQAPQYGDKSAIENMERSMSATPMTQQAVPRRGTSQTAPAAPPQGAPPAAAPGVAAPSGVPQAHLDMFSAQALALKAAQSLGAKASAPGAGPWLRYYADVAAQRYNALAAHTKANTPFFKVQQ